MMDERSSDELYWQLMREGMRPAAGGTAKASKMRANDPSEREGFLGQDRSPSGGKGSRPKLKAGRVQIIRSRPFLAVIIGGRA